MGELKGSGAEKDGGGVCGARFYQQVFVLQSETWMHLVTTATNLSIKDKNAQLNEYELKISETQVSVLED